MSMAVPVLAWGWHGLTPTILFIRSKSTKINEFLEALEVPVDHTDDEAPALVGLQGYLAHNPPLRRPQALDLS